MRKKVLDSQSLWDIALQELGDITGIVEFAEREDVGLTDDLPVGKELEIPQELMDKRLVAYYSGNGIYPATAISPVLVEGEGSLLLEGIEFWGIEYDFIIS